jgi:hypothetical protein
MQHRMTVGAHWHQVLDGIGLPLAPRCGKQILVMDVDEASSDAAVSLAEIEVADGASRSLRVYAGLTSRSAAFKPGCRHYVLATLCVNGECLAHVIFRIHWIEAEPPDVINPHFFKNSRDVVRNEDAG